MTDFDAPAAHPATASAPPNDLAPDQLRLRPGADGELSVDPQRAGWRHLAFRLTTVTRAPLEVGDPRREVAVVILAGSLDLDVDGTVHHLPGRSSVWEGLPWACYLPAGTSATARAPAGVSTVAIAEAPASGRSGAGGPIVITPDDVRVEIRGGGSATRQVNHIITPDFPADRLEVVEVYTPSGNWSSWPPHKHDTDDMPREAVLEEVYCYAFRRPEAWGIQRLYRADGSRDALWAVRHHEVVLVTDGYHPFVANHADDAYYLNALAGDRRTMACSYDPRLPGPETLADQPPDPRLPLVRAGD